MSETSMAEAGTRLTRWPAFVAGAVALCGVLLVLYAWRLPPFRSRIETTEDAYVRGNVTVIAPKVDGYVVDVKVKDYAAVHEGDVLVQLDDRIYAQKLALARANLLAQEANLANVAQARRVREVGILSATAAVATAQAQVVNSQAQLDRTRADQRRADALVGDGSVSEREHDQTRGLLRQAEAIAAQADAALVQARAARVVAEQDLQTVDVNRQAVAAGVESSRASERLAQIDLDNTRIRAPRDGVAGEIGVKLGQYAVPGTQLLALVPSDVWVIANFKEGQTGGMSPGQPVSLTVDALDDGELTGRIERIAPATGSEFSVIKPDNATGNFTKVPQRLPIRIAVDANARLRARLRPGMSVYVKVDTSSGKK